MAYTRWMIYRCSLSHWKWRCSIYLVTITAVFLRYYNFYLQSTWLRVTSRSASLSTLCLSNTIVDVRLCPRRCCLLISHFEHYALFSSPLSDDYTKTWLRPHFTNRKYITYSIIVFRGEPNHGCRQHAQKNSWSLDMRFCRATLSMLARRY